MDSYSTCILSLASFTKHIFEVHFVVCTSTSFYWQIVFHIDTPHSLKSTHEFMGIWIAHFLAVNDAAEHSYVQVYVWTYIFISLGYIFRIEVVNHMVTLCLIKKKTSKVLFQNGCTILHSHQQCMRAPISPHPHQLVILVDVLCYFNCGFDLDYLVANKVENLCVSVGHSFFFVQNVFQISCPFKIRFFSYYCIAKVPCILDIRSESNMTCKYFPLFSFHFLLVSF